MSAITPQNQLSVRTVNVLRAEGITSFEQLENMSDIDLLRVANFGQRSLLEARLAQVAHKLGTLQQAPSLESTLTEGRDLRDFFAAAALPAMLAVYDREICEGQSGFDVAPRCYRIADAMLEARK